MVIAMTDKGLKRRLDLFRDPVPVKSKSELHHRVQQWTLDVRDLTDEGHKPTDLDMTVSFKQLVSGVHEAKRLVDAIEESAIIRGVTPNYKAYREVIERESKEWYRESLEGNPKAKSAVHSGPVVKWIKSGVLSG